MRLLMPGSAKYRGSGEGGKAELAWKLLTMVIMNSSGNFTVGRSASRQLKKTKAQKQSRPRTRNGKTSHANGNYDTAMAAAGTLTRTKALLLAALRVWELKHRVGSE